MDVSDLITDFITFTLGLPRVLGMFAMIPIFGRQALPGSARNAVAVAFTLFMYPVYSAGLDVASLSSISLLGIIIKEAVIGMLMGFAIGTIFWGVQSMGFVIDNQRGATMASSIDPMTGTQTSPLGIFMMQVLTVFFYISGGVFFMLRAFYNSYLAFPVATFYPNLTMDGAVHFLSLMDSILALALLFAAPALIAMFLSEFALGLVSRFAPQLNVFFLSMPVKSAVGMLLLLLSLTYVSGVWMTYFEGMPDHIWILQDLLQ